MLIRMLHNKQVVIAGHIQLSLRKESIIDLDESIAAPLVEAGDAEALVNAVVPSTTVTEQSQEVAEPVVTEKKKRGSSE